MLQSLVVYHVITKVIPLCNLLAVVTEERRRGTVVIVSVSEVDLNARILSTSRLVRNVLAGSLGSILTWYRMHDLSTSTLHAC